MTIIYLVNFWHLQKAHILFFVLRNSQVWAYNEEQENNTKLFKTTCIFSKILR